MLPAASSSNLYYIIIFEKNLTGGKFSKPATRLRLRRIAADEAPQDDRHTTAELLRPEVAPSFDGAPHDPPTMRAPRRGERGEPETGGKSPWSI